MHYFVCFVAKSSTLEMKAYFLMMSFGWGQYTGAGIQVVILLVSTLNENVFIKSFANKCSPYLCLSSSCSSLLGLAFAAGCKPLPSETVSGVCPPCKSSDNPLSPGTHSKNKISSEAMHQSDFISFPVWK